jgi:hypothetical protein
MEVLIDPGSQLNLISNTLAIEQKLHIEKMPELLAECANGSECRVYSTTLANIAITDSRRRKETHRVPFIVTDLQRYPIYLGLP